MVKSEVHACFAKNCTNSRKQFPSKGFFGFPSDIILCSIWLENSGRGKVDANVVINGKSYHKICADHFEDKYFLDESKTILNRRLNPVPTLFVTEKGDDSSMDNSGTEDVYSCDDPELLQNVLGGMSNLKPDTVLHHIDELCRFCMNSIETTDEYFEIANDSGEMSELKTICEILLQKEVDFSDRLINKICLRCVNDLKVCQTMIEQLKTADHYLKAIAKFSLYFKTDEDDSEPSSSQSINDTYNFDGNHINIPRKAMVMPLDTFMADFEGSELYLEDIEKDSGILEFDFTADNVPQETYASFLFQSVDQDIKIETSPEKRKQASQILADEDLPACPPTPKAGIMKLSDNVDVSKAGKSNSEKKSVTFLLDSCDKQTNSNEQTDEILSNLTSDVEIVIDDENTDIQDAIESNNSAVSRKRRKRNVGNRFTVKRRKKSMYGSSPKRPLRFILPKSLLVETVYNGQKEENKGESVKKTFSCKFCSMKVDNEEDLIEHTREKHEDEMFKCLKCNEFEEGFNTKSALIAHIKDNHRHECSECGAVFYSSERLARHTAAKHDYSVDCKVCGKRFRNPHRRKMHMYTHKTKAQYEMCWFCGKSIHKNSFNMHLEIHFQRPHACNICQKVCRTKSAMLYHRKSHFMPEEEKGEFLCGICPKTFDSEIRLTKHISGHSPKLLKCGHCGKKFKRMKSLQLHEVDRIERGGKCPLKVIRGVPYITEEPIHPCDVCNRMFIKPENVIRHRKYHFCKGDEEVIQKLLAQPEVYRCEICERYLFSKITFQYHMSKHTGDKEPFKCEFCGKACKTHHAIAVHERRHTGERPFICRHCGRGFQEIKICRSHEATHDDEKPFPCPCCKKSFKSRRQLVSHTRTHLDASSVRPYSCPHCNRQFILDRDLQGHVNRYHSKSKEGVLELDYSNVTSGGGYACSECGRVFAVENYCKKHMRLVHGIRFVSEAIVIDQTSELDNSSDQPNGSTAEMYQVVVEEEGEEVGESSQVFDGDEVEIQYLDEDGSGETTEISFIEDPVQITT